MMLRRSISARLWQSGPTFMCREKRLIDLPISSQVRSSQENDQVLVFPQHHQDRIAPLAGYFEALRTKKEYLRAKINSNLANFLRYELDSPVHSYVQKDQDGNFILPQALPFPVPTCKLDDLIRMNSLQSTCVIEDFDMMGFGLNGDLIIHVTRSLIHKIGKLHLDGTVLMNLEPQNVVVFEGECEQPSFDDNGNDSLGWKAAEELVSGEATKASNMFSFGCILYYCITGGYHPFGNTLDQRIRNILANKMDISRATNDDASDLLSLLLSPQPELRPSAKDVISHPFFWDLEQKVAFLMGIFLNRDVERRDRLAKKVERKLPIFMNPDWCQNLEDYDGTLDRRKRPGFKVFKDVFRPQGSPTFLPRLLMSSYKIVKRVHKNKGWFKRYNLPDQTFNYPIGSENNWLS